MIGLIDGSVFYFWRAFQRNSDRDRLRERGEWGAFDIWIWICVDFFFFKQFTRNLKAVSEDSNLNI